MALTWVEISRERTAWGVDPHTRLIAHRIETPDELRSLAAWRGSIPFGLSLGRERNLIFLGARFDEEIPTIWNLLLGANQPRLTGDIKLSRQHELISEMKMTVPSHMSEPRRRVLIQDVYARINPMVVEPNHRILSDGRRTVDVIFNERGQLMFVAAVS